jgi:hypothetical protein
MGTLSKEASNRNRAIKARACQKEADWAPCRPITVSDQQEKVGSFLWAGDVSFGSSSCLDADGSPAAALCTTC